jgi:DNA-binding LacI/PurR family transcriptional regulator
MEQFVSHLTELGHRSIVYLHKDDPDYGFAVRALRGYISACRRHNVTPLPNPVNYLPKPAKRRCTGCWINTRR